MLNDLLSGYLKKYVENPDADEYVVDCINNFLGPTIESLTFHIVLKEKGITDMVAHLSPEALIGSDIDYAEIISKLTFLEENVNKLRMSVPVRTREDWETFHSAMAGVCGRMRAEGQQPTYPDFMDRLDSNKFVFYKPNEKAHSTGSNVISSKRRQWTMCLRGSEFITHCEQNNIQVLKRRVF